MEFPDLGKHCSDPTCHQLDFLPVQCDACQKVFCSSHYQYSKHNCPEAYKKDNQVPVCPLCNRPVPVPPGQSPDMIVGQHIDNDCQSETAQTRRKVYSNKCSVKGCKQKEVMPLLCERCRLNYCLRHRNELDHECKGFQGSGHSVSSAGAAAISRATSSFKKSSPLPSSQMNGGPRPTAVTVNALQQPGISEEEAIRRAIELSLQADGNKGQTPGGVIDVDKKAQEEADEALARALQESERQQRQQLNTGRQNSTNNNTNRSCAMS